MSELLSVYQTVGAPWSFYLGATKLRKQTGLTTLTPLDKPFDAKRLATVRRRVTTARG